MIKHSKAPWTASFKGTEIEGVSIAFTIDGADRINITYGQAQEHIGEGGLTEEEVRANAALIAASPDLLAKLQDVLARIENSEHWWMDCPNRGGFDADAIRSTIAKATRSKS